MKLIVSDSIAVKHSLRINGVCLSSYAPCFDIHLQHQNEKLRISLPTSVKDIYIEANDGDTWVIYTRVWFRAVFILSIFLMSVSSWFGSYNVRFVLLCTGFALLVVLGFIMLWRSDWTYLVDKIS